LPHRSSEPPQGPKRPLGLRQERDEGRAGAGQLGRQLRGEQAGPRDQHAKKDRTASDSSHKAASLHVSNNSSDSSRNSSISNTHFTDLKKVKSATASLASTASNLALRTKVPSSFGSI
jgi:hypothetical protein